LSRGDFYFYLYQQSLWRYSNYLPLVELEKRYEIAKDYQYYQGIDETMSIDQSKHSIFGASKVAADVMVQEYGRYFNMPPRFSWRLFNRAGA
jgi:hypothetical protein